MVPMGLLYLAEACRLAGFAPQVVQLHDAAALIQGMEGGRRFTDERWRLVVERLLEETTPRAVGIQCHWSYQAAGAHAVARWVKTCAPEVHVTLGGVHAGALAEATLEQVPEVDAVVVGDGDGAYPALLRALEAGGALDVPGVVVRRADGTITGGGRQAAPLPADDVPLLSFDTDLLWPPGRGRLVGLPFMRGRCPQPCTYCSLNSERLYPGLQRSLEAQLEAQLPVLIARQVPLYLPEHFAGPKPLEALARALEASEAPASVVLVDVHPKMIKGRAVEALARIRARCERLRLWLGVESGSERVRARAGRVISTADILGAFASLAEAGIPELQAAMMVGLPGETNADVMESDALIEQLNARGVLANVLPVVAFPETAIFRDPDAFGVTLRMRTPRDFERLSHGWHAPIDAPAISLASDALDVEARICATLKLRLRQRERLGYRTTPELFRTMEHLPGLRVPGETETMIERYAPYLESDRFGPRVRPSRVWRPETQA